MSPTKGKEIDTTTEQRAAIVAKFAKMAEAIPTNESTTGIVNILAAIEAADEPGALGGAWGSTAGDQLLDEVIKVTDLKRLPSDFATGLGFFLVVSCHVERTGELQTFTTGSVAVVAQLVKAWANSWMPLRCALKQATRPTADGYYPQHLQVYGVGDDF